MHNKQNLHHIPVIYNNNVIVCFIKLYSLAMYTLQMDPLFKAKYEQLLANLKERFKTGEPIELKE